MASVLSIIDNLSILITNIVGKQIDLTKLFLQVEIVESLFEIFLNGKLILLDSLDLLSHFPLIGNEDLQINIDTNQYDLPITLDFKVYKIDKDVETISGDRKNKIVTLYFCSPELLKNYSTSISRKFEDNAQDIAEWLFNNPLESSRTLNFDQSTEDITIYGNFWRPLRIMDYLSRVSKTSSYSDFIFFERLDGFYFKPLSYYLNQDKIQNLTYDTSGGSFIKINNIRAFKFKSYFDILSLLKIGFFGSTLYNYDEQLYDYKKTEAIFSDIESDFVSLGNNSNFDPDLSQKTNLIKESYADHDIRNIRYTLMKLINTYNLVIKLYGDFNRKICDIVNFSFPNLDNENPINDRFDGNWIIMNIRHIIKQDTSYEQNLLLTKNASFKQDDLSSISLLKNP